MWDAFGTPKAPGPCANVSGSLGQDRFPRLSVGDADCITVSFEMFVDGTRDVDVGLAVPAGFAVISGEPRYRGPPPPRGEPLRWVVETQATTAGEWHIGLTMRDGGELPSGGWTYTVVDRETT